MMAVQELRAARDLYPMKFAPLFQYRPWGGRRFQDIFGWELPGDGLIGEAWILSDRTDLASVVSNGPLQGTTLAALLENYPHAMLGSQEGRFRRFPLLLKFLDVQKTLSVQVHPGDNRPDLLPPGEMGKTEGWVVLDAHQKSRIYAGVKPGVTPDDLRNLTRDTVDQRLNFFHPNPGDSVLVEAGTVHALGGGAVVFEVQENSDVTFRLYDWNNIDPATGKLRPLQVEKALSCVDFEKANVKPVALESLKASANSRDLALDCSHFRVWRVARDTPVGVGGDGLCRVCVFIEGAGLLESSKTPLECRKGDVVVLAASLGTCWFEPRGPAQFLEIMIPEAP